MKRILKTLPLILAVMMLAGCADSIDDRFERAQQHHADGMLESAVADYRSVLEEDPDHAEARLGLGQVQLLAGDYANAESSLRRADRLGIDSERVLPPLAQALLWQQRYDAVLEHIDPMRVDDDSLRANLIAARARAHAGREDMATAREKVAEALAIDDMAVQALVMSGQLAIGDDQTDQALDYVERARAVEEESAAALLLSAQLQRHLGNRSDSIDQYRELMELGPTDISQNEFFSARGALVEQLAQAGDMDAAREESETMLRHGPRHPYSNYLAAALAMDAEDWRTANDHLQTAISAAPDNTQIKSLLGTLRIEQGQYAQATTLLQDVVFAQPENIRARILLATAYRGVNQDGQATRVLAEGLPYAADDPQLLAALVQGLDGDMEEFTRALDRLSGPDDVLRQTRFAAAETLVGRGETGPAIEMLRNMETEGDDDLARRQFMVIAAMQGGDTEGAREEAQGIVEDYPDNATSYNLLGGIELMTERFDQARAAFERARELDPDNARAHFNLGLLAEAQQDLDGAIRHFEQGLELEPGNTQVMAQLADMLRRQDRQPAALRWAERAVEANPDSLQLQMVLARQHLTMGNAEAALTPAQRAVDLAPDNAAAHGMLGVSQLESGDGSAAVETLTRAHELNPDAANWQLQLARAQAATDDTAAMRETLDDLLAREPGVTEARIARTRLDLQENRAEAALENALVLQETSSSYTEGLLLEGRARQLMEDFEGAARAFQAAADEGRLDAMGPLISSREAMGEDEPAQPLEDWIVENPDNAQARFSLGNWYIERSRYESAIGHYEALFDLTDGENAIVLNNLAWLYHQTDDDRALETARQAHRLAPENADIMDTLGWIHHGRGDHEEALELLARAAEAAPQSAQIRYHHGATLIARGDTEAGREEIREALEMEPEASWADDAHGLLDEG